VKLVPDDEKHIKEHYELDLAIFVLQGIFNEFISKRRAGRTVFHIPLKRIKWAELNRSSRVELDLIGTELGHEELGLSTRTRQRCGKKIKKMEAKPCTH
jgi:hypothetical protein